MKGITDQQDIFQRKDIEKPSSLETIGQSDCYNGGKNAFSFYQDKNNSLNDRRYRYYDQKVESYLGYILVRSLTPNALINFRKVTEHAVITFPYAELLSEMANNYYLHEIEYGKIKKQFFDDKAFSVFLLIGAFDLDNEAIKTLGAPSTDAFTDYAKLCEYVNYHSGEIFYLVFDYGEEMGIAMSDPQPQTINDEYIQYTGVYFKELRDNGRVFRFREENLLKEIHIGKFVFAQTEMIGVTPVKVKKVYENGKYLGPSIAEEDSFDY